MLCLASAGCGGKDNAPGADAEAVPITRQVSDGLTATVTTTNILTGTATRALAGPVGDPLVDDLANGIAPWGPVVATHTVTLKSGGTHVVNQLASPDPFTAQYQLEDGTLRTTNEPVTLCWDPDYHGQEPAKVNWINGQGETVQVYEHIILVWFDQAITEQALASLIAAQNLHVVMSWFEPLDGATGGGTSIGSGGGGTQPTSGNEIAYFEFEYDPQVWATLDAAVAFFNAHPNVDYVTPNIVAAYRTDYAPPNDYYYQLEARQNWPAELPDNFGAGYVTALGVDEIPEISDVGYSDQVIAVIDTGVARPAYDEATNTMWGHPDFGFWSVFSGNLNDPTKFSGKIVRTGVDCWPGNYDTRINGGQPMYGDAAHFGNHGTLVAGLISADTNNYIGIPALAPRAMILPVRAWYNANTESFDIGTIVKAFRALRMDFSHGDIDADESWNFQVRIVNCSFGGPTNAGIFTNIDRDLKLNDRLYVASAGNHRDSFTYGVYVYPAAFENVLGVTGLDAYIEYNSQLHRYFDVAYWGHDSDPGCGSNYYSASVYPVSAPYDVQRIPSQSSGIAVNLSLDIYIDKSSGYASLSGTSASAPCISALAFHLYDLADQHNNSVNRQIVMDHIIESVDQGTAWNNPPIAGIVSYNTAITTWPY
jgi:hypothetical protein